MKTLPMPTAAAMVLARIGMMNCATRLTMVRSEFAVPIAPPLAIESTPAMLAVENGIEAWTTALRDLAVNVEERQRMREAALDYSARRVANWAGVLEEDLLPGWRAALADGRR